MRKFVLTVAGMILGLALLAGAGLAYVLPVAAAYVCPHCYGLEPLGDNIFVEMGTDAGARTRIKGLIARSEKNVATFYGRFDATPRFLVCQTQNCTRRLGGGGGAKAMSYGDALVRVAAQGVSPTILTHELDHIELHHRIGMWRFMTGGLAAWFDEGLAVVVSKDRRYLAVAPDGTVSCLAKTIGDLPNSSGDWRRAAGRDPNPPSQGIYAQAACKVLDWLAANGGRPGLMAAIAETAAGRRRLP